MQSKFGMFECLKGMRRDVHAVDALMNVDVVILGNHLPGCGAVVSSFPCGILSTQIYCNIVNLINFFHSSNLEILLRKFMLNFFLQVFMFCHF